MSKYLSHSGRACSEEATNSDSGGNVNIASPGKQRRVFSGRWLGLRKPSQGKVLSGAQSPAANDKPVPLKKVLSDKKIKLPYVNDTERGEDHAATLDETEDDGADVELPPPMKPIQDPQTVLQQTPAPANSAATPAAREQHGGGAGAMPRGADEEEPPGTPLPTGGASSAESIEAVLKKREFVLRELVDTEEIYVADLRLICEGYMRHMQDPSADPPLPDGLRDLRHRMIFGNIEAIYDWHKDRFVRELRACIDSPELLGPLFRRFLEKKMFLYETYCRNKPVSEYIVSEHENYFQEIRQKLGHKLLLGDLLIKPIQRIQKYHLLVKKVLTYSESADLPPAVLSALRDAVHCTSVIPKNANDMMDVGRLQGFTGKISAQGKLMLQETLLVSEGGSDKVKELHVFLFEQCVIFSEAVGKKTQFTSPTYHYKAHIQMNKMDLYESEKDGAFVIQAIDPSKPQKWVCRASEARRDQWVTTLANMLRSQRMFGEALENPAAYLRELHRDPAA